MLITQRWGRENNLARRLLKNPSTRFWPGCGVYLERQFKSKNQKEVSFDVTFCSFSEYKVIPGNAVGLK